MPFHDFLELIQDPALNVTDEMQVVKAIDRYLTYRRTLPAEPAQEDETVLQHLTEEEKKNRQEQKAKAEEEQKSKEAEEKKAKDEHFAKLDALG